MLEGVESQASPATPQPSGVSLAGTRIVASVYLSGQELRALEAAAFPPRSIRAGSVLVREGEPTDHLQIVTEGWACRYKTTRDGARQIVALSMPGDTANLDSLMIQRPDYGVRALTAAKIVSIPRERTSALAAQHVGIARAFTFLALTETAILSQWAVRLGRFSARQRLAHLVCELSARLDGEDRNETSFELPLTQEHLADALGLTPVHVNRTLQQLRTEGVLERESRTVIIPDVARLRTLGEFDPTYLHIQAPNAGGTK